MEINNSIPNIYEELGGSKLMWDIYSRQLKDRIIWLGGEVNSYIANAIVAQLLYLDTKDTDKDITLYINSPGGSVTAGLAIYDTMNYIGCDVSTICVGQAASMGAFLLSSGAKGKRYCLPNSEVMIHQPLGGARGQATDIIIQADNILKVKNKLNSILSKNTGKTILEVFNATERDNYLDAQQALDFGLIDSIVSNRKKD